MLDKVAENGGKQGIRWHCVESASRLYAIQRQMCWPACRRAANGSRITAALPACLFEATSPGVGDAAANIRRIGSGRADCLALLLVAKHAKSLPPDDLRQLGLIASGGGQVSGILQTQAAWLYLKLAGKVDEGLSAIFK